MSVNMRDGCWGWLLCLCILFNSADLQGRELNLQQAVELALSASGDARVRLAEELVQEARSKKDLSRAELLPRVRGYISIQRQTRNLEAFGFQPQAGFPFPVSTFVGPFTTLDMRAGVNQSIFDLSTIRQYQSSEAGVRSAEQEAVRSRDQVAADAASLYMDALYSQRVLITGEASVALAESLLELASSRKAAGTGTEIEVVRARVQLSNERQLLLAARNDVSQALLRLCKVTGLEYDLDIQLTDSLDPPPGDLISVDSAIETAQRSRSDLSAQREKVHSAQLAYSSARWERLPSLAGFADYGTIGTNTGSKLPTWTAGLSLQIPFFEGGSIEARRGQLSSRLRQEGVRLEELVRQVELEVRLAHQAMLLSASEVAVAREGLELAREEMARAQRRYSAGVVTGLEVTDAQTRLRRAEDNRTLALFRFNVARVELWKAMGTVRSSVVAAG